MLRGRGLKLFTGGFFRQISRALILSFASFVLTGSAFAGLQISLHEDEDIDGTPYTKRDFVAVDGPAYVLKRRGQVDFHLKRNEFPASVPVQTEFGLSPHPSSPSPRPLFCDGRGDGDDGWAERELN